MYNPSNLWMFKHHCRRLISFLALAFLQCKIMLLWHGTKSMNLDTMPCVGPTRPGIFIWRPPWSLGKVKSAVDVLGAICQASLLHLTKAAVSRLNSFSGQIITGPEKARGGARVHSISLKLFSLERSLFFLQEAHHFCYSIHYVSSLGGAVKPHVVTCAQESDWRPTMDYLQICSFVFDSFWFPRMSASQAVWVMVYSSWEVTLSFCLLAYGALSTHRCQVRLPVFLSFGA